MYYCGSRPKSSIQKWWLHGFFKPWQHGNRCRKAIQAALTTIRYYKIRLMLGQNLGHVRHYHWWRCKSTTRNSFQYFSIEPYLGKDSRLNIGPKVLLVKNMADLPIGIPKHIVFRFTCQRPRSSRNLLTYRYNQLDKAIENAAKLGFTNGAALYPMVTMNGEECHNEWEITFEEIHRRSHCICHL
jgi:hypothetical protein